MKYIIILLIITTLIITGCNNNKEQEKNCNEIQTLIQDAENKINAEGLGCGIIKNNNEYKLTFVDKRVETICRPVFNEYLELQEEYKECIKNE